MKKLISAALALLMFATSAIAAPPPRPPRGGPGGSGEPRPPRPAPRPGAPRPSRPAPRPGLQRPPRPAPPRPGIQRPPRPVPPHPGGGARPPRPLPPRPPRPNLRPPVRPGHRPPPPPPPRFYYRHHRHHWHSDWFIGGLGLGLIIGALSNKSDYNAQYDYARRAEEVRLAARETAEQQSKHLVEIISRIGSQDALYELNEYWQAQGQSTALETSDPVRSLRVTGFQEDLTIVYWLDRAAREETVTVSAPLYNVSETARSRYSEPPGAPGESTLAARDPVAPAANVAESEAEPEAFRRLGFTLDEKARTQDGHLIVQSVAPSTVAAYTGMEKGATLYSIDGNTTAQVSVEQLCAFIERRAALGASVKVAFSDGAAQKTVVMQL